MPYNDPENDRERHAFWRSVRTGCVWLARLAVDEAIQFAWRRLFGSDSPKRWF